MNKIKTGYKETKIGLIPEDWSIEKLGDKMNCFSGGTPSRSNINYYNGSIPWIKSGELNKKFIYYTEELIDENAIRDSATRYIEPDTLLYALYGATAGIPAFSKIKATINQAILAIVTAEDLDSIYLYFWLLHNKKDLLNVYTQGAQPNLSAQIVKDYTIPLPPLPEQKKIAEILSTWDRAIEKTEKLIDAKLKLKKALMQQLLTGKKKSPHNKDKWKKVSLSNVFEEVIRPAKLEDNQIYTLVTVKRRREGIEKRSDLYGKQVLTKSQFYIKANDFLISKRQIVHGACGVVPTGLDNSVVSNEYLVLRTRVGFDVNFMRYYSYMPVFQRDCYLASIGVHIEKMLFKPEWWFKTQHYLPPMAQQQRIASVLSTIDKEISVLNKKLKAIKQQKKGLMQKLLTGEVRVKV